MPITIPIRKNVKAKTIAQTNPELSAQEIGRIVGLSTGNVNAALKREQFGDRFGQDNPKKRRP